MLPQLRELERRFGDVLAVVGVHSGKFPAERETPRLREAMARLGVAHPVVNDRQLRAWRAFAVRAWPTIVLVDPAGYVVAQHAGEITAAQVAPLVERIAAEARAAGTLAPRDVPHAPEPPARAPGVLHHPGKVAVARLPDGAQRMAVADTGHDRVLVGTLDARGTRLAVTHVVGDARGLVNARAIPLALAAPQGVLLDGDALWIADAGAHVVRVVDLATGAARVAAGTGARPRTRADLAAGGLASPWDLARAGDAVWVATAGQHQLHALDARTGARTGAHVGTMREELADGPLAEALLAQPMGLATDGRTLWFADAESSAVRAAGVGTDGAVTTLVGTGLFDSGHRDGAGDEARLQHPQGVARLPDGTLVVADSYNDALRRVDPATRACTTWVRGLHEPGGACADDEGTVWVADTNAHRVVLVEPGGTVREVEIDTAVRGA